jgi:transcriptional regulator with XRE-family HTH domain
LYFWPKPLTASFAGGDPERIEHRTENAVLRNLKAIRAHIGILQGELARRAALQQSHLSYLERGASPADANVVVRIADALGVPPAALTQDVVLRAGGRVELADRAGERRQMAYSA